MNEADGGKRQPRHGALPLTSAGHPREAVAPGIPGTFSGTLVFMSHSHKGLP